MPFRFNKIINEKTLEFYQEQRKKLKKKVAQKENMPTFQPSILKCMSKIGFLYEFTKDYAHSNKYFKSCHSILIQQLNFLKSSYDIWEIKALADAIMLKLAKVYLSMNNAQQLISLFVLHFTSLKQYSGEGDLSFEYMV